MGDVAGAAGDLALATRPLPENARAWDAYFVRCMALSSVQRWEEAEADCKRVLDLNPGHIVSLDRLAWVAYQQGDYEAAASYWSEVLEIQEDNAIAWANRGESYTQLGRYEEAVADQTRAIELAPTLAKAHNERGFNLLFLDRPQEALADLARAVELYDADPEAAIASRMQPGEAHTTRLFVALYSGEYELAIQDADSVERLGLVSPWVVGNRGLAYLELGELQRGLDEINRALAMDADFALNYDRRGYAYYLLGDYDRALADFDEALSRLASLNGPQQRSDLFYHRALLFQAQGRLAAAADEAAEAAREAEVPSVRRQIEELERALEAQGVVVR
jgi:tetratricopeptide (TPR) repeat protein